jgi:hypothetical protein
MAIHLDVHCKEWSELLQGKLSTKLSSLSLQLKLNALQVNVKKEKMTLLVAATELYNYCNANPQMYERDLKNIFKNLN